ncbi:MAG: hypothetical protein HDR28_06230 [Lachnospiraceae bacterium]|nr:hypothetical protein [Lachnospiraceae bacterium]MBD5504041.1 hypothetical protein [Lachnospiraceae bacterium]
MNYFIDSGIIDSLCSVSNENITPAREEIPNCDVCEEAQVETVSQQSVWTKISSKVKEIWGKIKPVVSGLTAFFTVATIFVKSVTKFGAQCKNLKAVFA